MLAMNDFRASVVPDRICSIFSEFQDKNMTVSPQQASKKACLEQSDRQHTWRSQASKPSKPSKQEGLSGAKRQTAYLAKPSKPSKQEGLSGAKRQTGILGEAKQASQASQASKKACLEQSDRQAYLAKPSKQASKPLFVK